MSGAFAFPTTLTFNDSTNSNASTTATITNGYQLSTATAAYTQNNCVGVTVTVSGVQTPGWKCGPDSHGIYSISAGGGCKLANGTAVQPSQSDWSSSTGCTNTTLSGGYSQSSCTVTVSGSGTATCTNVGGIFNSDNTPYTGGSNFDFSSVATLVTAGANCSTTDTSTEIGKITKALCYANYYQSSGANQTAGSCLPKIQANWSATSATDAVSVDFGPNNLVFENQYVPNPDGSGGSLLTRQEEYNGVQIKDSSGNSQYVPCHVIDTGGLSFIKVPNGGGKLLVTYVSSQVTTDVSKPACAAAYKGTKQTYMFYVVPQ